MTDARPAAGDRPEPYLESLDSSTPGRVVALEWARYLVDAFGTAGAVRALRYYQDVHWISRSVRRTMVDHVRSQSPGNPDGPDGGPAELVSLAGTPFEAHARSLEYVAAIADDSLAAELQPLRLPSIAESSGTVGETVDDSSDAAGPDADPDAGPPAVTAEQRSDAEQEAATAESAVERVGVVGGLETAATFHLLAGDGDRSRCGMVDAESETAHDVGAVLPRNEAREAGLSCCIRCRDSSGE